MSKEFYGNQLEKKLCEKYTELFEQSEICMDCRETFYKKKGGELSAPLSAWMVGNDFCLPEGDNTRILKPRILFVGKNAIGDAGGELQGNFRSVFKSSRESTWAWKKSSRPFWKYTKEIVEKIFHDSSTEHIAMTNFVKCNAAAVTKTSSDTTTKAMKDYCILNLKVLRNEIEIIKPNMIIFYTGRDYDHYIGEPLFDKFDIIENTSKKICNRDMAWCTGKGIVNKHSIDVLRVGHPQGKQKEKYKEAVCDWIQDTQK